MSTRTGKPATPPVPSANHERKQQKTAEGRYHGKRPEIPAAECGVELLKYKADTTEAAA